MKKLVCLVVSICLLILAAPALAADDQVLGKTLVENFFGLVAAKDWATLEKHLAPCFQSAHSDGARGRAQELALLKKLNLGNYKLSGFKTTRQGKVVVVSYAVRASETIDGKRLGDQPAQRLTVFSYDQTAWQILAHANLRSLVK